MDNEILHRIEHKLDLIIEKMRLSSISDIPLSGPEREDHEKQLNHYSLPQDPRACPLCFQAVAIRTTPHVFYDKDGKREVQGYYRACGCDIVPLKGVL